MRLQCQRQVFESVLMYVLHAYGNMILHAEPGAFFLEETLVLAAFIREGHRRKNIWPYSLDKTTFFNKNNHFFKSYT